MRHMGSKCHSRSSDRAPLQGLGALSHVSRNVFSDLLWRSPRLTKGTPDTIHVRGEMRGPNPEWTHHPQFRPPSQEPGHRPKVTYALALDFVPPSHIDVLCSTLACIMAAGDTATLGALHSGGKNADA